MPDSRHPHAANSFRLNTFGGAALVDGSGTVVGEQRRRLALLALVASAGDRGVSRDRLIAYLSPESPAESARHALHQLLYYLRQQVGDEVFQGTDPLRLNATVVSSDVRDFEQALAAGKLAEAIALYRGPFMEGFHLTDSAEFEEWAAQERSRFATLHAEALRSLATQAHSAGEFPTAVEWWRQLVRVDPLSGRTALGFMRSLAEAGDVPGALQHARIHQGMLRESLSSELDPEVVAYVARLQNGWKAGAHAAPAEPAHTPPSPTPSAGSLTVPPRGLQRKFLMAGSVGALIILVLAAVFTPYRSPRGAAAGLTAVLPFRVTAPDSSIAWLHEGMVELLTIRLAGEGGMPVVQPGVSLSAWHRTVPVGEEVPSGVTLERIAREINANQIIDGSVTGTGNRVLLTAWLRTPSGEGGAVQASAEGLRDSLPDLVDQLAARLLGLSSGVAGDRLASLTSASLPALRAFLAGRAALRRGQSAEAMRRFHEAILIDSTFALSGLELVRVGFQVGLEENVSRGHLVARRGRDRLAPADRALLDVLTDQFTTASELFRKWNIVVQAYPDRPESWYGLGDSYFHWGGLAGLDRSFERAEDAFARGWHLDSAAVNTGSIAPVMSVAEPILHLVELAHVRGDTARVRYLVNRVQEIGGAGDLPQVLRWHLAVVEGDSARDAFWRELEAAGQMISKKVIVFIQSSGIGGADFDRAFRSNRRKVGLEQPNMLPYVDRMYAFNRGQVPSLIEGPGPLPRSGLRNRIHDALFWSGDTVDARQAVAAMQQYANPSQLPGLAAREQYSDICALGIWDAAHQSHAKAAMAAQRLRTVQDPEGLDGIALGSFRRHAELCAALLEAWNASEVTPADAPARLASADSLAREFIFAVCCGEAVTEANLILAKLWEDRGDIPRALKAIRRRSGGFELGSQYLSTFTREDGRLSLLVGDTVGAIRAYRHYLAFRANPSPELRGEAHAVEDALARLEQRPLSSH